MSLLVVAYPILEDPDYQRIQAFRALHDPLYHGIVEPHFSLVFPVDWQLKPMVEEALPIAMRWPVIDFVLRCAVVQKDGFNDMYHVFLVPDEGHSDIVKLHDKLYGGRLADQLRLDLGFVPHIGIGNDPDPQRCKAMADLWNAEKFEIRGQIIRLTVIAYRDGQVTDLLNLPLDRS